MRAVALQKCIQSHRYTLRANRLAMLVFSVLWSIVICLAITAPAQAADRVIVKFSWLAMSDMQSLGPLFADPLSACKQEVDYYNAPRSSRGFGYNNVRTLSNGGCLADYFNYYLYISLPLRPFPLIYPDQQLAWAKRIYQCPTNSVYYLTAADHVECACNSGYVVDGGGTACVAPTTCPVGQKVHPYGGCMLDCAAGLFPNMDDTACIPDSSPNCTIKPLNPLPTSISDACSNVLENLSSTQAQKDAACGTLKPELIADMACLTTKLEALSTAANIRPPLSLTQTAGVRTDAYQAHFREVWEKMENLTKLENENPAMKIACPARRLEIAKEKGCNNVGKCENACLPASVGQRSHCFRGRPAKPSSDAKHPKGKANDVGSSEINRLKTVLSNQSPPQTIPQFLASPTGGCNVGQLGWGGTFTGNIDAVHFYVP